MIKENEEYVEERTRNTAVKRCTCYNLFQDKRYGIGLRLHNRRQKSGDAGWRCTVCGNLK